MRMNGFLAIVIMNAISWIATGVVATVAINSTGNAAWAFLILIPAIFGYSYKETPKQNDTDSKG